MSNDKQPEALRLADLAAQLELSAQDQLRVAVELRRLHAAKRPTPHDAQLLIDNIKAAHLEWLSVDGDAEEGVSLARASEALAVAESKLLAALTGQP